MPPEIPTFGAYHILTQDDGTFRLCSKDSGGMVAAVLAVCDRYGEQGDLVAWAIDNPTRWWLRYGDLTPVLGSRHLAWANDERSDATLHGSPEGWMLAGMKGACVIDWGVDLRALFEDIPRIYCDTNELREHLGKALRRHAPRLLTKGGRRGQ